MARSKEGKKDEFYLSQIRALKSENRNLKKKLKQLEKREHFYEDDYLPMGKENITYEPVCSECNKGRLETVTILDRVFEKCNICDYRTKTKRL